MISRSTQCLAFLCLVLVWDITAVNLRAQKSQKKPATTTVCKALPISMRYRLQIQTQIDLAQLAVSTSPIIRWPAEDGGPAFIPRFTRTHGGGDDLIYRLKSLQL